MKVLIPCRFFFHVDDRSYPEYIHEGNGLGAPDITLYTVLFRAAKRDGCCRLSQEALCHKSKIGRRSLQDHLKKLADLGYIDIVREAKGNSYCLLLSPTVLALITACNIPLLDTAMAEISALMPAQPAAAIPAVGDWEDSASTPSPALFSAPASLVGQAIGQTVGQAHNVPAVPFASPGAHAQNPHILSDDPSGGQAQNMRMPCAKSAPSSYMYIRDLRNKIPPTPQAPAAHTEPSLPDVGPVGESVFSAPRKTSRAQPLAQEEFQAARQNFEHLWAIWPVKKDKLYACRRFMALARARVLPALHVVLDAVDRLRREDAHWLAGYPPKLACWLSGHGWNDEPFIRSNFVQAKREDPPVARVDSAAFFQRHAAREEAMGAVSPEVTQRWLNIFRERFGFGIPAAGAAGAVCDGRPPAGTEKALEARVGRATAIQAFREKFVDVGIGPGTACFA